MESTAASARWTVAAVILSWNGRADTLACVDSLASSRRSDLRVIVVDNGSADGTEGVLRQRHPDVTVLQTGSNLGFSGGNNVGIHWALRDGVDAVLLLNNDTWVAPDAIDHLVAALQSDPAAGICSPVLPYAHDPDRLWFAGAPFDPCRWRAGRSSVYERGLAPLPDGPVAIDRVTGAAMLARASVFHQVGGLADELFFLYEDVDWSLRVRAAGWQIMLVPAARVVHKVAASQGGMPHTPTTAYYGTRNDLEIGRRHGHAGGLRALAREAGCLAVHLAVVRRARHATRTACLTATLAGWRDYRRRRLGKRPSPAL